MQDGTIDVVASDHSPAPPSTRLLESGDFTQAWGGIAGELACRSIFNLAEWCLHNTVDHVLSNIIIAVKAPHGSASHIDG